MLTKLRQILSRDEPTPVADELRLEVQSLRREIQRVVLENQGLLEETTTEPQPEPTLEKAMTINYGQSRTGRKDWFATGKTFTENYGGWNTSNTRIFLNGSGDMSEDEFRPILQTLINLHLLEDGFKMGGRIEGF
jgi:hypothetical protein